jgi:peptidoglycan hydrolase-like amidase
VKRITIILLLALSAGCASTGSPPPSRGQTAPTATPTLADPIVVPTPTPVPTPVPTGPVPVMADIGVGSAPIRVLLKKTADVMTLPQPGRAYRAEVGDEAVWLWGPLEITSSGEVAWQVGAWSSSEAATSVSDVLARQLGDGARVWQESASENLVRVRVRWPGGEPTDAKAQLAAAGFGEAFRVSGAKTVLITGAGGSLESSSEVVLTPAGDWSTAVGGRRYRGRFRVRSAGNELLLINELDMENYLRGVVPVEMGPYQFPELEALKAQAVAARTYAVAHLGDHDNEGWDICATPACQAYHGAGAEHPLSDRAVKETAGLIAVYADQPIDAMYTSTCGGHTEDSAELFSGRAHPYLTGVACAWDRPILLAGEGPAEPIGDLRAFRRLLARRALDLGSDRGSPIGILPAVAELCDGEVLPLPPDPDLAGWTEALLAAGGLDETSPLVDGEGAGRLVQLADLFEIPLQPTTPGRWRDGWFFEAAVAVLELQDVIRSDRGEVVPHPDGAAIYPRRADASEPLPRPLPLIWRWGGSYGGASALRVLPGAAIERYRLGDRILALVVVQSDGGGDAGRRSAWRSWKRELSWDQLEASLGEPELERLEIIRRGRSGRVVSLAVYDRGGKRRLVKGFDVRKALGLPETLFEMHVRTLPDGERVAHFLGRGWGHGVGLCQNGAYGLARAGMTYDAILRHYYTGVDLAAWRPE